MSLGMQLVEFYNNNYSLKISCYSLFTKWKF
jgi:hypothetical protein